MNEELPKLKWKNEEEHDGVLVQYLMDTLEELAERQPTLITDEQINEFDSKECINAVTNSRGVEYITNWVQRHQIPIDVAGIVKIGERDFEVLLKNYLEEGDEDFV